MSDLPLDEAGLESVRDWCIVAVAERRIGSRMPRRKKRAFALDREQNSDVAYAG